MKQVQLNYRTGLLTVDEVPTPTVQPGHVLVRNHYSVISPGTERAAQEFAAKSLIAKAQDRPELLRQVINKARRDGLKATYNAAISRLNTGVPLGYSSAGEVLESGGGTGFSQGDLVACAGGGYANHAEVISVPRNLVTMIPKGVPTEAAAFTTIGAIALQSVRIGEVSIGEKVAVIGMGLVGQLAVQIAKAAGTQVLAIDLDHDRVEMAGKLGADMAVQRPDAESATAQFSGGRGVDVVIITAATVANDPIELAATIARDKGRVVVVGDVGLAIPRALFYAKELELKLSRSYGPGRYDPAYEEMGLDYPYGYVRWTEQRNMAAFLELLAEGKLQLNSLITHRFLLDEASHAYEVIQGRTNEQSLGVVLSYDTAKPLISKVPIGLPNRKKAEASIRVGLVGAGEFARSVLLPTMRALPDIAFHGVVTASGLSAANVAKQFGFQYCTANIEDLLADKDINCIVIATRHNLHAQQIEAALQAGKNVFVEKPLAIKEEELAAIVRVQRESSQRLMVGFNRRFAPLVLKMHDFLSARQRPIVATYRVNAGHLPQSHWTQHHDIGGGRIIGEACHFIHLLHFLTGTMPISVIATAVHANDSTTYDETVITITYADGSVGSVIYAAGGDTTYPKERLEVLGDGRIAILDNFHTLELVHNGHKKKLRSKGDKGYRGEWQSFVTTFQQGLDSPIPLNEAIATTLATFRVMDSIHTGQPQQMNYEAFLASC